MTGSGSCGGGPRYASDGTGCARLEKAARTAGGVSGRKSKGHDDVGEGTHSG